MKSYVLAGALTITLLACSNDAAQMMKFPEQPTVQRPQLQILNLHLTSQT